MNEIKLIIYDLDGTLCDETVDLHKLAFIDAVKLVTDISMTIDEHDNKFHFNGLPTKTKIQKLGLNEMSGKLVESYKHILTEANMENLKVDRDLIQMISALHQRGYYQYVASNASKVWVKKTIEKIGIEWLLDGYFSNNDVCHPKPSPEMYYKCMVDIGVRNVETLIVEDSEVGKQAIDNSGAHGLLIKNRTELSLDKIVSRIEEIS